MLFQALDDKKECLGVYLDGKLIHDVLPEGLTQTWSYSAFLRDTDVEYAKQLGINGRKRVEQELNWKMVGEKVDNILKQVII